MKSIGFLFIFLLSFNNCVSQCTSTNRPFINSLSFDTPSDGLINITNSTSEEYSIQQKVSNGTYVDLNFKVKNQGIYNFKSKGSDGSCFKIVSSVQNCLPSLEVCVPNWKVESLPFKNTVTVESVPNNEIIILKNNLQASIDFNVNSRFEFDDNDIICRDDYTYRIVVKKDASIITTHKKIIRVLAGECAVEEILVPTIFTPNDDRNNESFYLKGKQDDFYSIIIYDRWQNKIFETPDITVQWNGTIDNLGEPANEGLYYYVLKKKNKMADIVEVKGTLLLVR